jgi:ComF family protein
MKQRIWFPSWVREYLFPAGCGVCGGSLLDPEEAWYGLCKDCRDFFTSEKEIRCSRCGRHLISEIDCCLECREKGVQGLDCLTVVYPYIGSYRKLLRAYKFDGFRRLGNFLTEKILERIKNFALPVPAGAVLVPVPPRPGKLKHTGWDQIDHLAKLLMRAYRNGSCMPVYRCLKRLPSESQKKLNKESRKTNLFGRIVYTRRVPPTVIVFDDVITTGSTLEACAEALKAGGAEKVYGVCLFY